MKHQQFHYFSEILRKPGTELTHSLTINKLWAESRFVLHILRKSDHSKSCTFFENLPFDILKLRTEWRVVRFSDVCTSAMLVLLAIKVKVNLSLCLTKHHPMRTYLLLN